MYENDFNNDNKNISISQFANNTKRTLKIKILSSCQSERLKVYQEKKERKEKEIEIMNEQYNKNYKLLSMTIEQLTNYIRFISTQTEKEKKKLNSLLSFQNSLEISNKKLKKAIIKKTNKLKLYKVYKNFLLKVKYKVYDLDQIPNEAKITFGLIPTIVPKVEEKKKMFHRNSKCFIIEKEIKKPKRISMFYQERRRRRSSNSKIIQSNHHIPFQHEENEKEEIEEVQRSNIVPVFESVTEFDFILSSIEDEIINMFQQYDKETEALTILRNERNMEYKEEPKEIKDNNGYYNLLIEDLKKVKDKNKELMYRKSNLQIALNKYQNIVCYKRQLRNF